MRYDKPCQIINIIHINYCLPKNVNGGAFISFSDVNVLLGVPVRDELDSAHSITTTLYNVLHLTQGKIGIKLE